MAGDWIKIRCDLHDDPDTIGIAERTGLDVDAVVGKLVKLWSWASRQLHLRHADVTPVSRSCHADVTVASRNSSRSCHGDVTPVSRACHARVTLSFVDNHVKFPGFAEAMRAVGWLDQDDHGHIILPNFERHNTQTAKDRALARERQKRHRDTTVTRPLRERDRSVTESVTRPLRDRYAERDTSVTQEKRREEFPPNPPVGGSVATESPSPTPTSGQGLFDPEPVLTFPTVGGKRGGADSWHLRAEMVAELAACFPGLDILVECRKALAWVTSAPGNRKTAGGMKRFLLGWLERAQNSGRGRQPAPTAKPETLEEKMDRLLREQGGQS